MQNAPNSGGARRIGAKSMLHMHNAPRVRARAEFGAIYTSEQPGAMAGASPNPGHAVSPRPPALATRPEPPATESARVRVAGDPGPVTAGRASAPPASWGSPAGR